MKCSLLLGEIFIFSFGKFVVALQTEYLLHSRDLIEKDIISKNTMHKIICRNELQTIVMHTSYDLKGLEFRKSHAILLKPVFTFSLGFGALNCNHLKELLQKQRKKVFAQKNSLVENRLQTRSRNGPKLSESSRVRFNNIWSC